MSEFRRFSLSPLLKPLQGRYPYQFRQPPYDVEQSMYVEWLPVFEALCADVDALIGADPRGFYWSNLKEKFGGPRWRPCFTHGLDEANQSRIFDLIHKAQNRVQTSRHLQISGP